jgi:hypothetical protein
MTKSYLVIWYMIASLGSVWLQKQQGRKWLQKLFKVCDCKNFWFISVTAKKKKKELNQCVIATIWRAWLQPGVMCGCKKIWLCLCGWKTTWLFGIWLQVWVVCDCKTKVCDCKNCWFISVTAKKKKRTEPVCDCNYLTCVIATRSYVWLQKNLTLSVWLKSYWVIWNMIASLGSVWLQKLKCVIAKTAGLFLWLQKKKELNQCVIATVWRAWLQPGVMCGCKKTWLCLCGWKATWLFGIWLQAWVVCDCKNYLKRVIAKIAGLFLCLQKRKKELNQCVITTSWRAWLQPGVMCGCKTW